MNDLREQFIDHPLVKEKTIERRPYQETIPSACCKENTLACLPTGLGKSIIAARVEAERLRLPPDKKVVILAPTRPLVLQHCKTFQNAIQLDTSEFIAVTGTRDEAYYWIARRKERMLTEAVRQMTPTAEEKQQLKLEEFMRRLSTIRPSGKKVTLIVDSREAGSPIIKELSKFDVKIDLETLKIGDFILSDRVAVEKKTTEDFTSSIIDGRLFTQVMNLKSVYQMPIVLVEGETLYSAREIRPEAVMGALVSVLIDYDVPIVWMRTPPETALFLFSIARREQFKERREPKIRAETKPATLSESQEFIIAGLPHVDRVLARRLLKTFGSVERVFSASEEELQKVEGIGKKISEMIRKIVSSKYEETS